MLFSGHDYSPTFFIWQLWLVNPSLLVLNVVKRSALLLCSRMCRKGKAVALSSFVVIGAKIARSQDIKSSPEKMEKISNPGPDYYRCVWL